LDDIANYNFDAQGSIKSLLAPEDQPAPKTIKSISLSPWHPPPYHLRTKGHLLYLIVVTNEGEQYHITSHISGFFVNRSSHNKFDPFPKQAPKNFSEHSLLTLLRKISPSFDASFKALQEHNSKRDPLTLFQLSNAIPASPWMVRSPSTTMQEHQADIARTQETNLLLGSENAESLRDWNEEFQTTRELPKETVQDKVFRERLTSKLFADYNEAAVRGAVLIARGEVPPLNPTEAREAQIFVYNNVFYSFGADGVGTFGTDGGDEAARVATGKDVVGVRAVNQLDINGLFTPGTVVVDYLGKRIVGQSIVPGIFKQREPGEHQIDYGGVEGKDVVAENEAFVPLFEKLSSALHVKKHGVWDKEGKRHDLEGSVETKGLLGTDGRKYVLDLYRITPLDVSWLDQYWGETGEERKGPEKKDYPHRMAVLRQELVESYARLKLREYMEMELAKQSKSLSEEKPEKQVNGHREVNRSQEKESNEMVADEKENSEVQLEKPSEPPRVDISKFRFGLNPDVFSGQSPQTDEEKNQQTKDEAEVRSVCSYLTTQVIPHVIHEFQEGEVGFPMDGESLTTILHKRGINMRYLGAIAKLADSDNQRLRALQLLVIQEMVARAFKHVVNERLRQLPVVFAPSCVSHLLNCLIGSGHNPEPVAETDESLKAMYQDVDFSYEKVDPSGLRQEVVDQIRMRFRFDLVGDLVIKGKELQMLREVALKLGLQLAAKDYAFTDEPQTNGTNGNQMPPSPTETSIANGHPTGNKKKKKCKDHSSPHRAASPSSSPSLTFHADDILNFVPIVKESSPRSVLAEEAFEGGRMSITQDQREIGQELLLESLSLYEQIYGILHPEVARVYLQLSSIYYNMEEKNAAVELARKAVIVAERTMGVDSSETILSYLNLGLFEHAIGNSKTALSYVLHALELWKIVYGSNHPDSITTINNAAVMLQSMKRYHESRLWFEASLHISEAISGKHSVNTATLLFQFAQALALDKDSHAAVNRMRESCNIFRSALGPEDPNTKEAEQWLDQLTQNAVNIAKRTKDLQSSKLRGTHFMTRVPVAARPGPVGESPTGVVVNGNVAKRNGTYELDNRNIDELIRYIDGDQKPSSRKKRSSNPKRRGGAATKVTR
jgi:protein TIF31